MSYRINCRTPDASVLRDPKVRGLLLDRFKVVQLDVRDAATPVLAPDGRQLTPLRWAVELGLAHLRGILFQRHTREKSMERLKSGQRGVADSH